MLPEGWMRSTVGEACAIKNNLRLPLNVEQRSELKGSYPYFGPTGVLDYINHYRIDEEFAVIGEDGDHFLKYREKPMTLHFSGKANVNNHAHVIGASTRCSPKWFYYWFMHRDLTPALSRQGVGRYKLTKKALCNLEIWLPPLSEQRSIAQVLATWDAAIEVSRRDATAAKKQLDALAYVVLMGRRRFGQADSSAVQESQYGPIPSDWRYVCISDIATEVSLRPGLQDAWPVLSCTKHDGLVDSLEYFKKRVFSEDTSKYKVAPRGSFVYATNHIEEGSLGYQDLYDAGLVSPIYTVFRTEPPVCDAYLHALLKTEHYRQIFAAATNASVDRRGSLRWRDFRAIKVPQPPLDEQQLIAGVLADARREVHLLQQQVTALEREKSALMSELLTGKRRVRLPTVEAAV